MDPYADVQIKTRVDSGQMPGPNFELTGELQSVRSGWTSALLIKSLFLLKMIPEIIDPVVRSFQLGCIKGQIRTF